MAFFMKSLLGSLAVAILLAPQATIIHAVPIVWTGPSVAFSKQGTDDVDDAAFQDRLTSNVWLTRGSSEGPFNIAPGVETGYTRFTSPAGTRWATSAMAANTGKTITADNYAQLSFTDWAPSFGGPGFSLLGNLLTRNAVVHLVTDNIYLDIQFTGFNSTGLMAYTRSSPAPLVATDGDYNDNGTVDAADYVLWRKTLNQSATPNGSGADGNGDGTVNAGDYTFWRARFGNDVGGAESGVGSAIPEPAAGPLAVFAYLSMYGIRRRR